MNSSPTEDENAENTALFIWIQWERAKGEAAGFLLFGMFVD